MLDADDLLFVVEEVKKNTPVVVIFDGIEYLALAAMTGNGRVEIIVDPLDEIDPSGIGSEDLI